MNRLQSVQNAAARLVTGLGRREHITPVLRTLHWLPVRQRIQFKLATLVYRSLTKDAPAYLSDECRLTSSVCLRSLRSADSRTCIPRRAHNSHGDRYFATCRSTVCGIVCRYSFDNLQDVSFERFKKLLKTFLFRWRDRGALRLVVKSAVYKIFFYFFLLLQSFHGAVPVSLFR
jgi:hypothetical protein